jgi:hypothetical protein
MQSQTDTLIGFQHAQRNFAAANEPKLLCEIDGDHNDTFTASAEKLHNGLTEFLRLAESQAPIR